MTKRTADLSTALSEAQEWLDDVSGELKEAMREYDRYKDSEDIEEVKAAMESITDCIDRALSRLE